MDAATQDDDPPLIGREQRFRVGTKTDERVVLDVAGDPPCCFRPLQPPDHMERSVDAGRDAGGRDDSPIVDEFRILVALRCRCNELQEGDVVVVRGDIEPVEQLQLAENRGTVADREHQPRRAGSSGDPLHQVRVVHRRLDGTARNHEHVGCRVLGNADRRHEPEPTDALNWRPG